MEISELAENSSKRNNKYKIIAKSNWHFWRLILSDNGITYADASNMDIVELLEANAAIDIQQEHIKKEQDKHRRK